ncbi:MAG TPA: hypothetical protein DCS80_09490 [Betaproteobacteria bacterium]|nr:hypothetical protein [Betaproteobacteria bacterium]
MCGPARSYQLGPSKLIIFCTLTERAAGPHAVMIYLIQGKTQYAIYFEKQSASNEESGPLLVGGVM